MAITLIKLYFRDCVQSCKNDKYTTTHIWSCDGLRNHSEKSQVYTCIRTRTGN